MHVESNVAVLHSDEVMPALLELYVQSWSLEHPGPIFQNSQEPLPGFLNPLKNIYSCSLIKVSLDSPLFLCLVRDYTRQVIGLLSKMSGDNTQMELSMESHLIFADDF